MSRLPTISAVFVTWNRRNLLLSAIESLVAQEYPGLEIIVVDNASTDDTEGALAALPFPVRYLRNEKNLGASEGRNQGVRVSGGDLLLFMDSDAELLTQGGLLTLVRLLAGEERCAAVSGVFYSDRDRTKLWCWSPCMDQEGFHDPHASLTPKRDVEVLSTCFVLVRRRIFCRVGGFDPFFFYLYEDADLSCRIRDLGYSLCVDPDVHILHHYADPGRIDRDRIEYHRYHERLRLYYLLKICGLGRWCRSVWGLAGHPGRTRARFPYLTWSCFLEMYVWWPCLQLVAYPSLRRRRRQDWIERSPPPSRTEVLGGRPHEP